MQQELSLRCGIWIRVLGSTSVVLKEYGPWNQLHLRHMPGANHFTSLSLFLTAKITILVLWALWKLGEVDSALRHGWWRGGASCPLLTVSKWMRECGARVVSPLGQQQSLPLAFSW